MRTRWKIAAAAVLAAALLTGCRDKGPSPVEVARETGIAYMDHGEYEKAVASFEEAYGLCDDKMPKTKADISLYEAACQFKLGDFAAVKETSTRVLNEMENADAYYMRGTAFLHLGDAEAAAADFNSAVALKPQEYELYMNIYFQYEDQNQSAIGDQYLQTALNLPGEEMEDFYQKAGIYFYLKDYDKARELLAKPVEANHKDAMMLMGEVYLAQGDSVHARNVYQQYIGEYGEDEQAYNGIAMCELADGNYDAALAAAASGLELEGDAKDKRDLMYNQIVAYERKGDFETAKQIAQQFVEAYPEDEKGKKEHDFLSTR